MSMDTKKMMQFEVNKKSAGTAYLIWFFLGMFGMHRFYLGKTGSGAAQLILTVLSLGLLPFGVGGVLIFVPGLWAFFDVFFIGGMVRRHNETLISMLT